MRSVRRGCASCVGGTLAFIAAFGSAGHARAQAPAGSTAKVAAETLFEEGRRLMNEGKGAEACPKFAESQRLDPSPSTLINLASCYEKTDHPATAWATYREGASAASAAGRQDLVATAQRHANLLFPALPRLSLSVPTPVDGTVVALDGVSVGRAEWGVAVPVDPGEHTVEASAPHFKPWSTKLTVGKEATTIAVSVPVLEAAPPEPAASSATSATPSSSSSSSSSPSSSPPPAADSPDNRSAGSTQRIAGIVVGAAGVVSVAVGAGFAASAKSQYNSSLSSCTGSPPDQCTQTGFDQRNSAINAGNVATALLAAGGIVAVGGVVLWLTAPSASHPGSLALVPGFGGGMLRGTW